MLIDVTRLVQRSLKGMLPTGVDRVSRAYVENYADRAAALVRVAGHWAVLGTRDSRRLFNALLYHGPGSVRRLAWSACRGIAAPTVRRRHQVLLHTGHSGLDQAGFAREVKRRQLLPIYFAHDLIPISHPEFCRAGEAQRHHKRLRTMIDTGKALIANSQATRAALADYGSEHGLRLPECVVAPLAPAALPRPSDQTPLAHDYFVVLGTIEPRKNHALLLQVWRRLIEQLGAGAPKLVVMGRRGWKCERIVELLDRCPVLNGHVLHIPHCEDRELSSWLHHARALLFPSFAEGFGMPLVEALSLGTPVIASNLPVFREVAGSVPEFINPLDEDGWHRAIVDYIQRDCARRPIQLERLRAYSPTTWGEHFKAVDMLLDRWLRRPEPAPAPTGWIHAPRY